MGHVHQLERERPELEDLGGRELAQLHLVELVLLELGARHRDRQRAAEDRWRVRPPPSVGQLAQDERQRAEVIS